MDILLKAIPIAIPVIIVILIFLMGYVKAPPDVAYIISGLRKHPKVLSGKAGIKIPFLERVDKLIVRQISIDIKSEGYIPTQDFIGVDVDAVAKVRVMTDPEGIQLAMKNFLNMTEEDFNRAIVDSLQGNMREIIGTITLKEICNDRKKFGDEVQSKAMMAGNRWRLFCLQFSFIGWSILCTLTLGLGNLALRPYEMAAIAAFYREISGGAAPKPELGSAF